MNATTILVQCPKCGQKIRIVATNDQVHITCPKCRALWDWNKGGTTGGAFREKMRGRTRDFWRAAVLQPRISFAGAAAALVAGLALGAYLGIHERTDASRKPPAGDFTAVLPAVQRGTPSGSNRPAVPTKSLPIERLLPSNGVDFGQETWPDTNR